MVFPSFPEALSIFRAPAYLSAAPSRCPWSVCGQSVLRGCPLNRLVPVQPPSEGSVLYLENVGAPVYRWCGEVPVISRHLYLVVGAGLQASCTGDSHRRRLFVPRLCS